MLVQLLTMRILLQTKLRREASNSDQNAQRLPSQEKPALHHLLLLTKRRQQFKQVHCDDSSWEAAGLQ
jgi:hypothetical protein